VTRSGRRGTVIVAEEVLKVVPGDVESIAKCCNYDLTESVERKWQARGIEETIKRSVATSVAGPATCDLSTPNERTRRHSRFLSIEQQHRNIAAIMRL
jgi:hypothetical protein